MDELLDDPTGRDEPLWTPEPIIGYRGWEWSGRRLVGAYVEWEQAKIEAKHEGRDGKDHPAPQWDCLCGVNVYKDPIQARAFPILGKIALTGEVIEFENGYRGQYGEILEIAIDETFEPQTDLPKLLTDIYKVPATREERIPWRKTQK